MTAQRSITSCSIVAGIGSWQGEDQVGWRIVRHLKTLPGLCIKSLALKEPTELISHLDHCQSLIVVDACLSGNSPGTVIEMSWPDQRLKLLRADTSHNFGVNSTLQLAQNLEILPKQITIYGIEVEHFDYGREIGPAVELAMKSLVHQIAQEVSCA